MSAPHTWSGRERLAAGDVGAVRLGGQPHQGHLPGGAVQAPGGPAREEAGAGGGGPYAAGDRVRGAEEEGDVPGTGGGLPGPSGQGEVDRPAAAAAGEAGGEGEGGAGRRAGVG